MTPSARPELSSKAAVLSPVYPGKNPHRTLTSTKFFHVPPYHESFSPPSSPPTPPPLPKRNPASRSNSFPKSAKSYFQANTKFSPHLSDIESCCSSNCSHLSGSVPVLTKVISFEPGHQPLTHTQMKDQIDLYNYSLDSLIPQIQQKPQMTGKSIPFQQSNKQHNPININRESLQKQEREKLNPLFKKMESVSEQRSSIIKELLEGHEHEGCVMKSGPVQNELKKLLNKSIKLKNKRSKPHIAMERFQNWVSANKKDERLVKTPDSDVRTDDNDSVTSFEQPRTRSDNHRTINKRHSSFRQSADISRHNSFKQNISGKRSTSRRHDYGRNSLRDLSLKNRREQNSPNLSREKSLRFSTRSYKWNKSLRGKHNENTNLSTGEHFSDFMSSDSSFGYSKIHSHSHRNEPLSKLERVKKAWKEDDEYFVNPRDPWRLLYEDSHSHYPTFRNPSNTHEFADELEIYNARKHENYTREPIPLRQRIRESWQREEYPQEYPQYHPSYKELNMENFIDHPLFDHLLPQTSDLIFRAAPQHKPVYLPSPVPAPLDPNNPEASPLVLGWLQVPESAASAGTNTANTPFRKAPWLNNLHFLPRR